MADSSFAVLNLGSQRVSGAIFAKGRNGELVLKAFEFAEMHGDPGAEATRLPQLRVALLELADKLKLRGKSAWVAIAGHVVFTRFVKLPPFDAEKADQIVEFEARQNVPFPINEVIWDYEFIGEANGVEREVALVAIKADALNDINEQVESIGVKTMGVDLSPLAVFNAFRYSYPDVEGSSLIIDLGAKSTNLIFVDGSKVFARNILVGGSVLTGILSKELGISFSEAESMKRSRGFVAPGGVYEAHEDGTIDAMSKIMRNSMTRLHGEVVRTINYYRSQQGGSPPRRFFLCGGGAQTEMMADFFVEKFNLPVEILNPLRGVLLDPRVDGIDASANAASMAELVGLALRHMGACPVEVELVPYSVSAERDSAKRAPYLIFATLCLFAAMMAGILFYQKADNVIKAKLASGKLELLELQKQDAAIKDLDKLLGLVVGQSQQLEQSIKDRGYWARILNALNSKFENDYIWLTKIEVLKNGGSMTPSLVANAGAQPSPVVPPVAVGAVVSEPQYQLNVHGLYRKNDKEAKVVDKYYDEVKAMTEFFMPPSTEDKLDTEIGVAEDRYAYGFKFRLPLIKRMKFDK